MFVRYFVGVISWFNVVLLFAFRDLWSYGRSELESHSRITFEAKYLSGKKLQAYI